MSNLEGPDAEPRRVTIPDDPTQSLLLTVVSEGTGVLRCEQFALEYDFETMTVSVAGEPVHLTNTELAILVLLLRTPRRVITRGEFLRMLWGPAAGDLDTRAIDAHIARLRRKLGASLSEGPVRTVRGLGYSLL